MPRASSGGTGAASGSARRAVFDTSQGAIVIELLPQAAPQTTSNFEKLVNWGFYDGLVWHRIVPGFVIQTGDPNSRGAVSSTRSTWGLGSAPNPVPLETDPNYRNDAGYVGLAHPSTSTSGSCQFYINLSNNGSLDGGYTVFGKVVRGMSVVEAIAALAVYSDGGSFGQQPVDAVSALILSATIQSKP
ncbi:MAG: peptidylprolyl isomerase [Nitrososphaerales archaeon]